MEGSELCRLPVKVSAANLVGYFTVCLQTAKKKKLLFFESTVLVTNTLVCLSHQQHDVSVSKIT